MHFDQIRTATIDQLTDELAAAGRDSTQTDIHDAREAVARLVNQSQPRQLCDSETGEAIRPATDDEAAESIAAGDEGHILVGGRKCYVE
jgi:hypothetical protein